MRQFLALLVLVVCAFAAGHWLYAQDIVPPTVPAAVVSMGTPLPSSVRANAPTSPTDPGIEGQLAVDDLYFYSFHNGIWKKSARANL